MVFNIVLSSFLQHQIKKWTF